MRATPAATQARGWAGSGRPATCTVPASAAIRPCSRSAKVCWPLPATPAIATTSPGSSARFTSSSCGQAPVPCTVTPRSSQTGLQTDLQTGWQTGSPAEAAAARGTRSTRCTARPTIACASCALLAPAAGSCATSLPARSTAMRWLTRSTSSSLWLMKMIASPCATSWPSVANSDSLSCGVSTAVGSSRIRMRAPRLRPKGSSAFRISTRWRSPTDSSAMRASGCTCRPKRCAVATSAARAAVRRDTGCHSGSVPSITLSSTLKLSASVKCWCTMPMPAASAAAGLPGGSGAPSTVIVPSSAR